jgi:hypothetical protein
MLQCSLLTASSCWLGFEFSSIFISAEIDIFTRIGIGIPCGIIILSWTFYLLNLYFPFTQTLGFSILFSFSLLSLLFRLLIPRSAIARPFRIPFLLFSVFLPTFFVSFLAYISILYHGDLVRGAVWADLPFHLNLISSFVYGCNSQRTSLFDNLSPFYANERLAYPVLPDFSASLMIGCFETPLQWAILIPSLPFIYSIFICLSRIAAIFSHKSVSVYLVPWLFLCLGGMGWSHIFNQELFNDMNVDMIHNWGNERTEYWFHPLFHYLFPQRLSLFALPICWSYILLQMVANKNWRIYLFCGLLIGLLPQVQGHGLIALLEWTFAHAIINFPWNRKKEISKYVLRYLLLGIPAIGLSVPQLSPFFNRISNHFSTFQSLWSDDHKSFLGLWWNGLGVFWVLSLFHCFTTMTFTQFKMYCPALFVFFLSNIIHYQPWNLDNTKVFYNAWIPLALAAVCHFFAVLIEGKLKIGVILTVLLFVISGLSSVYAISKAVWFPNPVWDAENPSDIANWAIANTPLKSVWLTDTHHNHPIPTLAGRQVILGYRGWVGSHNLDEIERLNAILEIAENPEVTDLIDGLQVEYLCICLFNSNEISFRLNGNSTKWKLEYFSEDYEIWKREDMEGFLPEE